MKGGATETTALAERAVSKALARLTKPLHFGAFLRGSRIVSPLLGR